MEDGAEKENLPAFFLQSLKIHSGPLSRCASRGVSIVPNEIITVHIGINTHKERRLCKISRYQVLSTNNSPVIYRRQLSQ
jgi:hypothetical protein